MKHLLYGMFWTEAAARSARSAISASPFALGACEIVRNELPLTGPDSTLRESDMGSGLASGLVVGALAGAVTAVGVAAMLASGDTLLGTAVFGGVAGAFYGAIGGALWGAAVPERHLRALVGRLRGGEVLLAAWADGVPARSEVEDLLWKHSAHEVTRRWTLD